MRNYNNILLAAIVVCLFAFSVNSQEYYYTLIRGSSITDECKICGRPTIPIPINGNFLIQITNQTPLGTRFFVKKIAFYAGQPDDPDILITGEGSGEIFGEVALVQRISLNLTIYRKGGTNRFLQFTNTPGVVTVPPPMVQCELVQTEDDMLQFYTLNINAAPYHEIWFSTESGFTSANRDMSGSPADILSSTGSKIKSKADLIKNLNLQNPPQDLNVDALDIITNGIILFSFDSAVTSVTLGVINEGDVVSDAGEIIYRNEQLLSKFGFMPPTPALGLDAIQVQDNGEVLFSTRSDAFSEKLGAMIQNGDILSSDGYIYRKNKTLLQQLQPSEPGIDYGLDAFYIWDNGEIWFSTKLGFNSSKVGTVLDGDLLSDSGYVVYKNLDLLSPFSPLEDLADFGLDALFIVTDLSVTTQPPKISKIKFENGFLNINWEGEGRVFRIESSDDVTGAFLPVQTTTSKNISVPSNNTAKQKQFFRIRQW
ncbi:MAG: hypothetical protein ACP5T0_00190 [Verrucomicrobiia bacterium]